MPERGLACYERWLAREGERWLAGARTPPTCSSGTRRPAAAGCSSIRVPTRSRSRPLGSRRSPRVELRACSCACISRPVKTPTRKARCALSSRSRFEQRGGVRARRAAGPPEEDPTNPRPTSSTAPFSESGASAMSAWGSATRVPRGRSRRAWTPSPRAFTLGHRILVSLRPLPAPRDEHRELRLPLLPRDAAPGEPIDSHRAPSSRLRPRASSGMRTRTCGVLARSRARRSSASPSRAARGWPQPCRGRPDGAGATSGGGPARGRRHGRGRHRRRTPPSTARAG